MADPANQRFDALLGQFPDFDGQRTADFLWRHATTPGSFAIWLMKGGAIANSGGFGASADWVIAGLGDVNGDGKTDILWRSSATNSLGIWFMNGRAVASTAVFGWGPGGIWSAAAMSTGMAFPTSSGVLSRQEHSVSGS